MHSEQARRLEPQRTFFVKVSTVSYASLVKQRQSMRELKVPPGTFRVRIRSGPP